MEGLSSSFLPRPSFIDTSPETNSFTTTKLISNTAGRIKLKTKKPETNPLNKLFKSIDDFICDSLDLPLRPLVDPKQVLSGNYAPVDELPPTPCELVEGSLPSCLDGVYIRNGPNPQFFPRGPHHLFDGDGMLHMVKISDGKPTFCSRYVNTYKHALERRLGHPIIPSFFSSFNGLTASAARVFLTAARILAGNFNPAINGYGTANTSVALINGKLYAIAESDLPYEIQVTSDGDIITVGRHDFHHGGSGGEEFSSMTAHPKTDPETGDTFAFRYHIIHPRLTLFRIDTNGQKQPDVPIFSMKSAAAIHDFAVTRNYAVFNEGQMTVSPSEILKGRPMMTVDEAMTPRIGVLHKYARDESEMRWIDVPGLNALHTVNAWEEGDGETLVMVATNLTAVELILKRLDLAHPRLEEIRISVKEKKLIERRPLSTRVLDFAVINQDFLGNKNRYLILFVTY